MKIEALENLKSDGYVLTAGDTITVPDEVGTIWCRHGWARDVDGAIPTGERQVLNAKLAVDSVKTIVKSADLGVKQNG